jgi:hypothetical protein
MLNGAYNLLIKALLKNYLQDSSIKRLIDIIKIEFETKKLSDTSLLFIFYSEQNQSLSSNMIKRIISSPESQILALSAEEKFDYDSLNKYQDISQLSPYYGDLVGELNKIIHQFSKVADKFNIFRETINELSNEIEEILI